jgi:hypothetical protein
MLPYGKRLKLAFRTFFWLIDFGEVPADVLDATKQKAAPAPPPPKPIVQPETMDRAVQMLAILQRDGRLVDFLMEDLTAYADAQVGAAVRDVHAGCRTALTRYATIGPVIEDEEGQTVTVERGTDPAAVKVTGSISGDPPYRGVLRHRGWQAARVELPPLPATGRTIIAPAEVEVS